MSKSTQYTIHDIAAQFDRLCPSQVDTSTSGNGQQESGHNGHEGQGEPHDVSVGWYTAGGNAGHSVCGLIPDQLDAIGQHLASFDAGSLDDIRDLRSALSQFDVEWHV